MTTSEHHLFGCAPVPLAHYLKALGVLRLVAEQADSEARGSWYNEHFVLGTALDREALIGFFLRSYRPTPMLAPWNGGSGFFAKDNQKGIEALSAGRAPRFAEFRDAILVCRDLLASLGLDQSPKEEAKQALVSKLRGSAPESLLVWLDAALLLSTNDLRFPPLLGTGGNDGRLDFTNNYMQRLVELIDPDRGMPAPGAEEWLRAALFAERAIGLARVAIGQFAPGAAGGPNASAGLDADPLVNPWDFVLMLEGAVPFAVAATRRLDSTGSSSLSYPFTVRPTGVGSGAVILADEKPARAEIWLPLWRRPATHAELRVLLAEGRATLGHHRPARDGLDFARSVARLGVDRGITDFQRYAFQRRAGLAYLATPLGRIEVQSNPAADLIDQLDERGDWLERFRRYARRDDAPARLASLGRRLDNALFTMASDRAPERVQDALIVLGEILAYCGRSAKAREVLRPLRPLHPNWIERADDRSPEFRLAVALAGLGARGRDLPMRQHFAPLDDRGRGWSELAPLFVWDYGSLVDNLIEVLRRRMIEAGRRDLPDKPFGSSRGADLADISEFLAGQTDDQRMAALLAGLVLVEPWADLAPRSSVLPSLPLAYTLLKPLFTPRRALVDMKALPPERSLPIPASLLPRLTSFRSSRDLVDALEIGARRARASGLSPAFDPKAVPGIGGLRQILERGYPNVLRRAAELAVASEGD